MGDGCLKRTANKKERCGSQSIEIVSIKKRFLDYLYNEYSPFFNQPKMRRSAKESALSSADSDYISTNDGSTFRTQYRIVSKAIPFFNKYDCWKSSGEKRWPRDIEFNPTQVKYLYVADGGLSWNKNSNSCRAQITSTNEPKMLRKMVEKFNGLGIECTQFDDRLMFKPTSTQQFLDFIGNEPVPGFEYKWEIDDLNEYEELYQKAYYDEVETYTV